MSGLTDWLDSNARRASRGQGPASWDVIDFPDIAVLEQELSDEDTAKFRALTEERALLAQFDTGTEVTR